MSRRHTTLELAIAVARVLKKHPDISTSNIQLHLGNAGINLHFNSLKRQLENFLDAGWLMHNGDTYDRRYKLNQALLLDLLAGRELTEVRQPA